MIYFVSIITIFLIIIFIFKNKDEKKEENTLDLSAPVQLKFIKDEYSRYEVQFFNPVKKSWWTLPGGYSYVHDIWTFKHKGSYGAYSLERLTCDYHEIESMKSQYKTLSDIKNLFDWMNKQYRECEDRRKYQDSLPNEL